MTLPASKTITTFNTWKAWLYDIQKRVAAAYYTTATLSFLKAT